MGPENPPRRSKSDQEPLTIDLEANGSGTREAEDSLEAQTMNADTTDAAAADGPHPELGQTSSSDAVPPHPEDALPQRSDIDDTSEVEQEDARAEAAAAAFAEEPAAAKESHSPAGRSAQPSNAGPLAAGILGGLIALLAAGGLQYAGILPSFGEQGGGNAALEQSLSADMEAIKAQLAAAPGGSDLGPIEARLAQLEKTAGAAGGAVTADISGLEAQVGSLTEELASLKSGLADAQQSTQAAKSELATRIDAAEKKIDAPASDIQLARAIAVTALKTAIDRGGPFLAELDALKSIDAADPAVTGLAGDAATGVVSRVDLTRDFPATADAMIEAIRHDDPNQGVFARLIDSASSVIRVRPVGSVEGDSPEAVVARIEDKLTNGDLKGASLEWEALPEAAKTAGAEFRTKLDRRIRVEGLIGTAVSGAMTANQG